MSMVPVRANSYMFDHGTRPAAMPRVTSPPTWNRNASQVSEVPMRANSALDRADTGGADASPAPSRRPPEPRPAPTSSRAGTTSFAATDRADRRARSHA
jgi:hypothetical protein